jgi:dTDP-4-amino-4,6-dideoxygalactose transaminase
MSKLAINGGPKIRETNFPAYRVIGGDEKRAVMKVLDSGILSRYLGCWHDDFFGGPKVRELESRWAEYFGVKHAITVNSCTSGLYCAVGASGAGPGDEIIVSPYTMSASAVAPLIYNAIPVFADIEPDYFCLDPISVEKRITERTKAIIVVDLFGHPYDWERINAIARKHNLIVIEDCAQAPGARSGDQMAGTLGDIGIYSLNYHKHIHTGEGGVVVTNDDDLADRVRLIRNHAEAVVEGKGTTNLVNMIGYNYRMTEIEAAIALCQLNKLEDFLSERINNCLYLNEKLAEIPAIGPTKIREGCTHSFYVHPLKFNQDSADIDRDTYIKAVRAELPPTELREQEGVLLSCGYVKPLYLQPIYQQKIAYGSDGFPFTGPHYSGQVDYSKGICPVAERMHGKEFFSHEMMRPPVTNNDLDDIVRAFSKVWEYRDKLTPELVNKD